MRAAELVGGPQLDALQDEWALPLKHFSATSLKMAMTCPEQYRQRYILGRKERPSGAAIHGKADHFAHEQNFVQKIESHEDLPVADVVDAFHHGWESAIEERDEEIDWKGNPETIRALGAQMVELYREEVAPRIQPTAVEWEFTTALDTVPIPLYGYVDLLAGEDGKPERIIERKTAARTEKRPKRQWNLQGRIYQTVVAQELKLALPVEWHVVTKLKTPTVITPLTADADLSLNFSGVEAEATRLLVERVAWTLNAYYVKFGPDEPWPGAGIVHDWACGFCGFRPECIWQAR